MQRLFEAPQPGLRAQLLSDGLVYVDSTTVDENGVEKVFSYWRENAYYDLTAAETDELAAAGNALWRMCIDAGDYIIEQDLFAKLGIPPWMIEPIRRSWQDDLPELYTPQIYSRFDIRYGGHSPLSDADPSLRVPKLLEFNADTPTSLVESSVCQWNWHLFTGKSDQWNNLFYALTKAWERNLSLYEARTRRKVKLIHFVHSSAETSGEDMMNTTLMADAAREAGYQVKCFFIEDIRLSQSDSQVVFGMGYEQGIRPGRFIDPDGEPIEIIFKLHPWEFLWDDSFGKTACWDMMQPDGTCWIEPPYKALWSNKGILPILWQLFGGDPERGQYLLPAYFEGEQPAGFTSYARKPLLGREGANVTLMRDGQTLETQPGSYGQEGYVLQQLAPLPNFQGPDGPHHPVMGVWMADGEACGLGIRESDGLITDNLSFFVPHAVTN